MNENEFPENTRPIGRFKGRNYPDYCINPDGIVWSKRHNTRRWKKKKNSHLARRSGQYVQLYDDSGDGMPRRHHIASLIRHVWGI